MPGEELHLTIPSVAPGSPLKGGMIPTATSVALTHYTHFGVASSQKLLTFFSGPSGREEPAQFLPNVSAFTHRRDIEEL